MLQLALQAGLSIVVTHVSVNISLEWTFVLYACLVGFCLIWMFFSMPETKRDRIQIDTRDPITLLEHKQWRQQMPSMTLREQFAVWFSPTQRSQTCVFHVYPQIITALLSPVNWWCILLTTISTG